MCCVDWELYSLILEMKLFFLLFNSSLSVVYKSKYINDTILVHSFDFPKLIT
jgi:hypothetical protein